MRLVVSMHFKFLDDKKEDPFDKGLPTKLII
jgi:hypothetical protein